MRLGLGRERERRRDMRECARTRAPARAATLYATFPPNGRSPGRNGDTPGAWVSVTPRAARSGSPKRASGRGPASALAYLAGWAVSGKSGYGLPAGSRRRPGTAAVLSRAPSDAHAGSRSGPRLDWRGAKFPGRGIPWTWRRGGRAGRRRGAVARRRGEFVTDGGARHSAHEGQGWGARQQPAVPQQNGQVSGALA